jgi:large conductance mechanosensitive channel
MKGFIDFIRKQSVVGLAIAFIMGAAITRVIQALVSDIINPLIGIFSNQLSNLKNLKLVIGSVEFLIGDFLSILIDFVIVSFVVFGLFELLKLKRLDKDDEK